MFINYYWMRFCNIQNNQGMYTSNSFVLRGEGGKGIRNSKDQV